MFNAKYSIENVYCLYSFFVVFQSVHEIQYKQIKHWQQSHRTLSIIFLTLTINQN